MRNLIALETVRSFLARVEPLLAPPDASQSEGKLKRSLDQLLELSDRVARVRESVDQIRETDPEMAETAERTLDQLPGLIEDYRRLLSVVSPGHPEAQPDLDRMNDLLAEREAREELGVPREFTPGVFEETTGRPNVGSALGSGIFALGWNAFTLFHATLMIGGMWKAVGPIALLLLLFYAIFFAVGFAMIGATINALSTESIRLEGRRLTVSKKLGPWVRSKTHELADAAPRIDAVTGGMRAKGAAPPRGIVLEDVNGKTVSIATQGSESLRQRLVNQLRAQLNSEPESDSLAERSG